MKEYNSFASSISQYFVFGSGLSLFDWLGFFLALGVTLFALVKIFEFILKLIAKANQNNDLNLYQQQMLVLTSSGFKEKQASDLITALHQQGVRRVLPLFRPESEGFETFAVEDAFDENEEKLLKRLSDQIKEGRQLLHSKFQDVPFQRIYVLSPSLVFFRAGENPQSELEQLLGIITRKGYRVESQSFETTNGILTRIILQPRENS